MRETRSKHGWGKLSRMEPSTIDSLWVLLSAFLVFFMHAGFSLLEAGLCRRKNAVAVLMKNFGVVAVASIAFYLVGYGLMFGEGTLLGAGPFAPDRSDVLVGTLPRLVHVLFQLMFAATACTIVSGAVAERSKLGPFFAFTAVATAFIYPLVGHAVWGGGLLAQWGFLDFAGSTVVHLVGGAMALAGAQVVGARRGKFDGERTKPMRAHNLPFAALGVMILWLGWFGFNGGSTLSAADPGAIAGIVLVTILAGAAGFLCALTYVKYRTGMHDFSMGLNGALAGLVSITAGCDQVGPLAALATGQSAASSALSACSCSSDGRSMTRSAPSRFTAQQASLEQSPSVSSAAARVSPRSAFKPAARRSCSSSRTARAASCGARSSPPSVCAWKRTTKTRASTWPSAAPPHTAMTSPARLRRRARLNPNPIPSPKPNLKLNLNPIPNLNPNPIPNLNLNLNLNRNLNLSL